MPLHAGSGYRRRSSVTSTTGSDMTDKVHTSGEVSEPGAGPADGEKAKFGGRHGDAVIFRTQNQKNFDVVVEFG